MPLGSSFSQLRQEVSVSITDHDDSWSPPFSCILVVSRSPTNLTSRDNDGRYYLSSNFQSKEEAKEALLGWMETTAILGSSRCSTFGHWARFAPFLCTTFLRVFKRKTYPSIVELYLSTMSDVISTIPLVGIPGEVKNRLNILDFVKNEKFFTLFVRALRQ